MDTIEIEVDRFKENPPMTCQPINVDFQCCGDALIDMPKFPAFELYSL